METDKTNLFALLMTYYLCDAIAAERMLSFPEAAACSGAYEDVKSAFRTPGLGGRAADKEAYLRFKAWEADNADLVRHLKALAVETPATS